MSAVSEPPTSSWISRAIAARSCSTLVCKCWASSCRRCFEATELAVGLDPGAPRLGGVDRVQQRRHEAREVVLQQVVAGAVAHRLDRGLLADLARDQDERDRRACSPSAGRARPGRRSPAGCSRRRRRPTARRARPGTRPRNRRGASARSGRRARRCASISSWSSSESSRCRTRKTRSRGCAGISRAVCRRATPRPPISASCAPRRMTNRTPRGRRGDAQAGRTLPRRRMATSTPSPRAVSARLPGSGTALTCWI